MPLNFGPLSREKGERRLNVAISRARDEMIVFASCEPEDIRAEKALNQGASYLKAFLSATPNSAKALANNAEGAAFRKRRLFSALSRR
jgi:superfamily I DNA and/or RNA helicase